MSVSEKLLLSGQHPNPVLLITNLTTAATLQHRCSHAASFSPCERVPAPNLGGAFKLSVLHSILLPPLACDDTSPRVHGGALKTGACSMRACTHTHGERDSNKTVPSPLPPTTSPTSLHLLTSEAQNSEPVTSPAQSPFVSARQHAT